MATRNIVPRANNEGSVGTSGKKWSAVHAVTMFVNGGAVAPLASPALTGNPTAPTQDPSDNSTRLATTAWVTGKLSGFVTSLASGNTGKIVVLQADGNFTFDSKTIADVLARANHTGSQAISTITGLQAALDAKATGVAADLLARANHTGEQAISTVTGLQAALDGKLADTSGAFGLTMLATANAGAARTALGLSSTDTPTFQGLEIGDNTIKASNITGKISGTGVTIRNGDGEAVLVIAAGGASSITSTFNGPVDISGNSTVDGTFAVTGAMTCASLNPSDKPTTRTNLGATAVGSSLFTVASPGFIAFPRINADNTVTLLSTADFRTAMGYGTAATLNVPAVGDAAVGEVVKGNDTRLTNARTPTSHTHVAADISDSTSLGRDLMKTAGQSAARSSLGLGTVATLNTGTTNGTVPVIGTGNTLTLASGGSGAALHGTSTTGYGVHGVGNNAFGAGVAGESTAGIGVNGGSTSGAGINGTTETGIGASGQATGSGIGGRFYTSAGTYHATFGLSGDNRSFVARVLGALGWWRGAYTGVIQAISTLTADRTWTLPDRTGTVCILESFVDDAAAGTGGYTTGQIYLNTTTGKPTAKT